MECNFKFIDSDGTENHVLDFDIECIRLASYNGCTYKYRVRAYINDKWKTVYLSPKNHSSEFSTFNTPEEAFSFADKIVKKYPRYSDKRDFDIALAPLYEGVDL